MPWAFNANVPSVMKPMWLTELYAMRRFMSGWTRQTIAPYTIAMIDRTMIIGTKCLVASGNIGRLNRMKPYVPIFRRTPARITLPAVGASVCASGSQV